MAANALAFSIAKSNDTWLGPISKLYCHTYRWKRGGKSKVGGDSSIGVPCKFSNGSLKAPGLALAQEKRRYAIFRIWHRFLLKSSYDQNLKLISLTNGTRMNFNVWRFVWAIPRLRIENCLLKHARICSWWIIQRRNFGRSLYCHHLSHRWDFGTRYYPTRTE